MEIQWHLVFYTLLVGAGVGVFALVAISELMGKGTQYHMSGSIISLVLLALGGFASFLHLQHPERGANILGNFRSPITQEMYLAVVTGLFILLYIVMIKIEASTLSKKVMAGLGLVFGILLVFFSGLLYVFPARPAWNTLLLPLIYFTSSLSLGIFVLYSWIRFKKLEEKAVSDFAMKALSALLILQSLLLVGYLVFLSANPYPDPTRSIGRVMGGDLTAFFWLGVVLVGLVVPLFLVFQSIKPKAGHSLPPLTIGAVGILATLVGGVAFRTLMYLLGTTVEKF